MIVIKILVFLLGVLLVVYTGFSAVRTFVLPRSARDRVTGAVFTYMRKIFNLIIKRFSSYHYRDQVMGYYVPIALFTLQITWLLLLGIGFAAMYWALGMESLHDVVMLSGSSLLTLGFAVPPGNQYLAITFFEAIIGLIQLALLISYLPTLYSAFSRRESAVSMLEVRAGSPPSAVVMIQRFNRLNRLEKLQDLWEDWEMWFVDIEETHTSLPMLAFYRSPQSAHSWVTAAGAVLDAASLYLSTIDGPRIVEGDLCLRAGYLSLRRIADYFQIEYDTEFLPDNRENARFVSITRDEFDTAYDELAASGVPLKPDREQAWYDFAGWRVNYDTVLLALAGMVMAPIAPWSSDRSPNRILRKGNRRNINALSSPKPQDKVAK